MKKLLAGILSVSLIALLCACGQVSGTLVDSAALQQSSSSQTSVSAQTGANESANEESQSDELFSKRDLSAEYDSNVVTIELLQTTARASSDTVGVEGSNVLISSAGTYLLSGTLENGTITVDAGKEDKIQLVLNGVSIHSENYAAIYVKEADKVFVTLAEGTENTLSNGGAFTQKDENNVDAVIFSKDDLTLNGTGSLTVTSPAGHGIVGKDEVTIASGTYSITAANHAIAANDLIAIASGTFRFNANKDGLHAENSDDATLGNIYIASGTFTIRVNDDAIHANTLLQIEGGEFSITAAEGLEATYILINGGTITISASDDGINAARKSSAYTPTVEINGGELSISMGAGDTDGIDSNGNLIITGGTIDITAGSAFDFDGSVQFTGGTVTVNGQRVTTIQNQMMGGGMGNMGGNPGGMGGRGMR